MLKYHFLDDYDSKYKVKDRETACYSKSKMEDMYPDGNYNILGETILKNKKEAIDQIEFGNVVFDVSEEGSHSKLFYKDVAYICTDESSGYYIKLLKRRWLLLWLLIGLLVATVLASLFLWPSDNPDIPELEKDTVYVSLPEGTVEYRFVSDVSGLDGYNLSVEMEHDDTKDIIHTQKVKLIKHNEIEKGTLDFPSLTFELKVGNYEGRMIYTKDTDTVEYPAEIRIRSANSGSMTISYSNVVTVNKANKSISLEYKHDKDATNDVKLQIILLDDGKEYVLGKSGIIYAGNSLSELKLKKTNIETGTYDGYIRLFIVAEDGSSTNVNTDIDVHIRVK